jgi:hypothetical protein
MRVELPTKRLCDQVPGDTFMLVGDGEVWMRTDCFINNATEVYCVRLLDGSLVAMRSGTGVIPIRVKAVVE